MTISQAIRESLKESCGTFQEKKDIIKKKTGINSFGCNATDLIIFNNEELQLLNSSGLISDEMYSKILN